MNDQMNDLDLFLETIHELEERVMHLIAKSDLTANEKMFLFEHILIVPGKTK